MNNIEIEFLVNKGELTHTTSLAIDPDEYKEFQEDLAIQKTI